MKTFLLYPDCDLEEKLHIPWNQQALSEDLELGTLFSTMANGDDFLLEVAQKVIFSSITNTPDMILYRQHILKDCLNYPDTIKSMYQGVVEAIAGEKNFFWGFNSRYASTILDRSLDVMKLYVDALIQLRKIAEDHSFQFASEGFAIFFDMLKRELHDEYIESIQEHLKELKFFNGLTLSARLGKGNKGGHYILHKSDRPNHNLIEWIFSKKPPSYTYTIADRDEAGFRALSGLKDRGINDVANALAQSCDHIKNFFQMLQTELAFYIGCLNLHDQITQWGEPLSFPTPIPAQDRSLQFKELYDICLALTMKQKVVGNDLTANRTTLCIITGANQGGKSTFLRSLGLAQLMMQSGMFVPAELFTSNGCDSLVTHYKREEDSSMESGKLDEELSRMDEIVQHLTPNALLLLNELFAATNEREGSEIAGQITRALMEYGIKLFYVTHLYDFAHTFYEKNLEGAIFLRAERENRDAHLQDFGG